MATATMPVSVWMVDALDLQPGHEVLELAAGTGEVGFLAAEQIEPGGTLISSDFVPEMITVAQGARGAARDHQRPLPPDRRRVDRPARRLARRRAVPLGLHADGRRRGRAARDAPHPAPRRARGAGGLDRPGREPVGVAPGARAGRRAATWSRPTPTRPGQFAWARTGIIEERLERRRLRRARGRRRRLHPDLPVLRRLDRRPARPREPLPRDARRARRGRARRRPGDACASRRSRSCRRTARSRCPRARGSRSPARSASVACPPCFYDDDADLSLLDGKTVAILGYGSQGHAHSLNLKDSGVDVVVGLREGSASVEKARGAGLEVTGLADAASRGDIVMVLLPDEKHGEVWKSEIADGVAPGNLLLFGHGFSIHFNEIDPPAEVDVGARRAEGPRPPRAPPVRRGARRPRPDRDPAGRDRQRQAADARLRPRHRLHARRRDRDDLQGRDRDGPVRRAGRAVRRRLRARQGRLRDARRRRLRPASSPTSSACTSSS